MKLMNILFAFFAAMAVLVGCSEEEQASTPYIETGIDAVTLAGDEGASASVSLTSNGEWSASVRYASDTDAGWLTLSPERGNGTGQPVSVTLSASENISGQERIAAVTFTSGIVYTTVKVTQGIFDNSPVISTIADFIAAPSGTSALYQLTGEVTSLSGTSFTLTDGENSVSVPSLAESETSSDDAIAQYGIKDGDSVTLIGSRGENAGSPAVIGAWYVSHEAGTPEIENKTIAEIQQLSSGVTVKTSGQVLAQGTDSFILGDAQNFIAVNNGDAISEVKLNDNVELQGTTSSLYGIIALDEVSVKSSVAGEPLTLIPADLSGSFSEITSGSIVRYVKYEGALSSDGTLTIDSSTGRMYPSSIDLSSLHGKNVILEAFYLGSENTTFYLLPVKAEEKQEEFFFNVSVNEIIIPAGETSVKFTVNASPSVSYSISVQPDMEFWEDTYSISPSTGGRGTAEYTITASSVNNDTRAHTAVMTVRVNNQDEVTLDTDSYDIKVTHEPASQGGGEEGSAFVKVTEALDDYSGTYLIVFEDLNKAFDGSLSNTDVGENNCIDVSVSNSRIEATESMKASSVEFIKDGEKYFMKTASGLYLFASNVRASEIRGTENYSSFAKNNYLQAVAFDSSVFTITAKSNGVMQYDAGSVKFYLPDYTASETLYKPVLYKLQ